MKYLLTILSTLTISTPVLAQNAVITGHGCGTGCSVSIEQLGLPFRMGNGWAKVRVRTTTRFYDMNGQETSFRGTPSGTQSTFTITGSTGNPSYNASSYNLGVGQDSLLNLTSGRPIYSISERCGDLETMNLI